MSNYLKRSRIAIIGGAGFIGHNLALSLASDGADVQVIDSLQVNNLLAVTGSPQSKHRDLHLRIIHERLELLRAAGIALHPQDARDYHALSRLLSSLKPTVIIHLAAVSHAGESNKDPYSTFDHSLRTLENALDYAKDAAGLEHFVFLSSSMAYGNFLTEEVSEDHPLNPMGIYGALKVAGEKMVIAYEQVFKLPATIVRPSALYGPRCVSRRVIQVFIENALTGAPIRMNDDGKERLDFTYIDDLVNGLKLIMGNPAAINGIFNLTYGRSRAIREVAEILRREFPGLQMESVERDSLMPIRGTLSVKHAMETLGYTPACPIDVGVPRYVDWYRSIWSPAGLTTV